jgi:FtsP/CotA-like multicopper oxidase with cupredoxin domain/fibronectin type 3 domain-containing protein
VNPYYDSNCDPETTWCEPELMPGVPYLSMGMEAFNDTPIVNGTAYPTTTVQPKSYRLRVLNAANDRFFNFSLYEADATGTEVALNPSEVEAAAAGDTTVFPTPVAPKGPDWIQIGTEGGFLPAPTVIPAQPITWVNDPTVFNAGNVDQHSLLLGPAERADVVVDFSKFAGKTLIVYNDAPAAFPARDARYDYYTGNADLRDTGGAPPTPAGFGPNTRTVMQIKVADTAPAPAFDLGALTAAFRHQADGSGVFESGQNPIIVGQGAYNSAYGTSFQSSGPNAGLVQIYDEKLSFPTLSGNQLTIDFQSKAIQDEMGEAFEKEYGRMSGNLGLEVPNAQAGQQQNLILYPFVNPASEIIDGVELEAGQIDAQPISSAADGTQIWKITHNGVDTHPIHFHLYDVQVLNRVGWDGIIRKPDANELGWKDTLRISPLEDTIVALRPIIPKIPFGVPDSIRPLNPMMPIGSEDGFNSVDANGNPITPPISNRVVNLGWEYVWHCHILSHEEMDMMRPISVRVDRALATPPTIRSFAVNPTTGAVSLAWSDTTAPDYGDPRTWASAQNEIGFRVERAPINKNATTGTYVKVGQTLANQTSFTDNTAVLGTSYRFRIVAFNAAGDSASAPVGGPLVPAPTAPTQVAVTAQSGPSLQVAWRDNASNESYFLLERSVNGSAAWSLVATPPARSNTGSASYTDNAVAAGQTYQYRVAAVNSGGTSAYATSPVVRVQAVPAAPSGLAATAVQSAKRANVTLTWTDNATDEGGFTIQRATNAAFTIGVNNQNVAAKAGSGTTVTVSQSGLYRGVTYFYRVRAFNLGGSSPWSNVSTVVTP